MAGSVEPTEDEPLERPPGRWRDADPATTSSERDVHHFSPRARGTCIVGRSPGLIGAWCVERGHHAAGGRDGAAFGGALPALVPLPLIASPRTAGRWPVRSADHADSRHACGVFFQVPGAASATCSTTRRRTIELPKEPMKKLPKVDGFTLGRGRAGAGCARRRGHRSVCATGRSSSCSIRPGSGAWKSPSSTSGT